jgi:formamidopyrimidine-DNA glycosylase
MPELPDLQVFSRNLDKQLSGKKLKKLTVVNKSKLKTSPASLKKSLEGETLKKVYRVGKELHFEFKNGNILGLHLMLNGNLYLYEKKHDRKYPIIEMLFDDDSGLVLTDFQGMANATLNPEEKPAPDALSDEVDYSFLKEKLSKKRTVIKTVLMDQKLIRGIGNAYADEILWDARIAPTSIANKVPNSNLKKLAKSIKSVLKKAEKQILKKDPDTISGEIRDFLLIHNSRKKESPKGAAILHTTIGGRKTYYTEEQEEFR